MNISHTTQSAFVKAAWDDVNRFQGCFTSTNLEAIESLALSLHQAWIEGRRVYMCGNGGSAANAMRIANDLNYRIGACAQEQSFQAYA